MGRPGAGLPARTRAGVSQARLGSGLTCLPRQDGQRNGWIKDYAVHVSADGKDWGAPVAQGTFKRDGNLHTIKFAAPVSTRFLKLIAVSSFDPAKPYASLAELPVITDR
jgi:hypothetical protein